MRSPVPAGGTAVTGTKSGSGPTTYDIAVPVSAIGNMTADSLLEEVTGFVTVSPTPAAVPITNVQAFAEIVPLQIEGTRTFNFRGSAVLPAQSGGPVAAPVLPRTGSSDSGLWAVAGVVLLGLAVGARKIRDLGR